MLSLESHSVIASDEHRKMGVLLATASLHV